MANLAVSSPNITLFITWSIIFGILIFAFRFLGLQIAGIMLLRDDQKFINDRKKTLADLMIMKDIQTELEKEIEQATLKAAFQN